MTDHILENGFDTSVQGYLCAKRHLDFLKNPLVDQKLHVEEKKKMEEYLRIFKNKCESFSTAAEKIAKIVLGKDNIKYLQWKEKKVNLDKWILTAIEKGQFCNK